MRDRPQGARADWSSGAAFRSRARLYRQAAGKGAQQSTIVCIVEQAFLPGSQRPVEVPDKVRARIEWILGAVGRVRQRVAAPGGHRRFGQRRVGEVKEAITALKTDLMTELQAPCAGTATGPWCQQMIKALLERTRPCAAAHAFAMRVENQEVDIYALGGQRPGDQVVDALDGHVGGDLSDEPSGIGETQLDRKIAALLHIGEEFRLFQQALDEAAAGLQRFRRFE